MGAVFAIQVRTGRETRAKEMLKHVLMKNNVSLVKSIHALETHTEFINNNETQKVDTDRSIDDNDISIHLEKEEYRASINNKRQQLEAIERYNEPEYEKIKNTYKKEIKQFEKGISKLRAVSKRVHSVLKGYLLVELECNSKYLPNFLWHLINSVPLVQSILSTTPIPEEEMEFFTSNISEILEPKTEIKFEKELDYETIQEKESQLLHEVNKKDTSKDAQEELFNKIDEVKLSVVEKVREILENKPLNHSFAKMKAFVKRKTEIVTMPLYYLEELYTKKELNFINGLISGKEFLNRLEQRLHKEVMLR